MYLLRASEKAPPPRPDEEYRPGLRQLGPHGASVIDCIVRSRGPSASSLEEASESHSHSLRCGDLRYGAVVPSWTMQIVPAFGRTTNTLPGYTTLEHVPRSQRWQGRGSDSDCRSRTKETSCSTVGQKDLVLRLSWLTLLSCAYLILGLANALSPTADLMRHRDCLSYSKRPQMDHGEHRVGLNCMILFFLTSMRLAFPTPKFPRWITENIVLD